MFSYEDLFYVVCFSHPIDSVGSDFEFQVLDSFERFWIGLFSHTYIAKLAWTERTGQSVPSARLGGGVSGRYLSKHWTCWQMSSLSSAKTRKYLLRANRRHLLEIFDDPESHQKLRLELAVKIDAGVHFVNGTYYH